MKKLILPIAILLLIGASIYAVNSYNSTAKKNHQEMEDSSFAEKPIQENDSATPSENRGLAWDFTFQNLQGDEVTLSDFRGKKILLNFWASWCEHCTLELPYIEELNKELDPEEAVIIAVNIGEERSTVSKFLRNNSYTFPIALDPLSTSAYQYNLEGIPTTFIIDEEGYIEAKYSGYIELSIMKEALGL